jgi:DNA polymerase (family 10)
LLATLARIQSVERVTTRDQREARIVTQGEEIRLHVVRPEEYAFALVAYTGSRDHVSLLAEHAAAQNLELSPFGLVHATTGDLVEAGSEEDVYGALGLAFIHPELRQGGEEIALAREGRLPDVLTVPQVRGDLHMHSDWSDGRSSIEEMARAARALGYEYIAITDHSPGSAAWRSLSEGSLERQITEIDRVRAEVSGLEILHGAEVDILPDGRLDLPAHLLERLDIVLASLHDPSGQSGQQLTDRYVTAMQHPLVSIITHPTNRLVGRSAGYDLDFNRLFEVARDTDTLLEVDGAPIHLDLDGALARKAVAAGVMLTVDSDCHRAEWLGRQMAFGVATARRGWVQARQVANTRPLDELRSILHRKRRRATRQTSP